VEEKDINVGRLLVLNSLPALGETKRGRPDMAAAMVKMGSRHPSSAPKSSIFPMRASTFMYGLMDNVCHVIARILNPRF
jgi:hypothetical protein